MSVCHIQAQNKPELIIKEKKRNAVTAASEWGCRETAWTVLNASVLEAGRKMPSIADVYCDRALSMSLSLMGAL